MAAVTILDGALAAGASTAFAAVPGVSAYTVQFNGTGSESLLLSLSNDGVNDMSLNTSGRITNISGGGLLNRTLAVSNTPVAFMRVTNSSASSVTAKVYVQAVA